LTAIVSGWESRNTLLCIINTYAVKSQSKTMTSQSPRVYTYKITFEEVPYYYYGVHKEKVFEEEYWGTPIANKWCWEFYTPKKQILEVFDYTDDGYIEAQKVEGRLIKPVYNTDKWCLNANCLGIFSIEQKRKAGKIAGNNCKNKKIGLFSLLREQLIENGRKTYEMKIGVHSLNKEQRVENARKAGKIGGKKTAQKNKELGLGFFSFDKEELSKNGKKGSKNTNTQKWMCLVTGYITTSGPLTMYQKKRGIDKSKRIRL
jgi:general stress protein YciG